jgi:hypothetical protein
MLYPVRAGHAIVKVNDSPLSTGQIKISDFSLIVGTMLIYGSILAAALGKNPWALLLLLIGFLLICLSRIALKFRIYLKETAHPLLASLTDRPHANEFGEPCFSQWAVHADQVGDQLNLSLLRYEPVIYFPPQKETPENIIRATTEKSQDFPIESLELLLETQDQWETHAREKEQEFVTALQKRQEAQEEARLREDQAVHILYLLRSR